MAKHLTVEPDLKFIEEIQGLGGDTLKSCFQCATCSVVCTISPGTHPFPRKEMIMASWGLKQNLITSPDVWLCHNCGDCSAMCPRGARPGDVLAAVRSLAIRDFSPSKRLSDLVNDPKKLPILLVLPALLFAFMAYLTQCFPQALSHGPIEGIAHSKFISTWLVDLIFVPLGIGAVTLFFLSIKKFLTAIQEDGRGKPIQLKPFLKAFIPTLVEIVRHERFSQCSENREKTTAHMMVLFGFIGSFIVTLFVFTLLYVFHIHGPFSQLNPLKWLANIAGVCLITGSTIMIFLRLKDGDSISNYRDWYLLGLTLGLGLTGMLAELTRLGGLEATSYAIYLVHLVFVFNFITFLPVSKLAHLAYRTLAMVYARYSKRE
ncbi:MAG: quinone-interacting membrane-bound oxidoreductase complex subunit QmoC [Desulfobacterium sp.]|nr:quinone-interacting membrane-bound oxidoreductase complex subunit QmoC [Desulfobacterium sp.]